MLRLAFSHNTCLLYGRDEIVKNERFKWGENSKYRTKVTISVISNDDEAMKLQKGD